MNEIMHDGIDQKVLSHISILLLLDDLRKGERGHVIMVVIVWFIGFIAIMQSVSITTNVVSLNPAQTRCT